MTTPSHHLPHDWFPRPLPPNITLGERSWCYSSFSCLHYHSQRPCGLSVGHDSGIYHGTFFNLGPTGEVQIGNYCTLVGPIFSTNHRIVIGHYSFLAHEVLLADSFAAVPPQPNTPPAEPITTIALGENCWIGTRAVLLPGAFIGQGAVVGAASVVDFEVPPYAIVAGNPARIVGAVNRTPDDTGTKPGKP